MSNQRLSISSDLFLAPVTESGFQSVSVLMSMTLTDPDTRGVITLWPHIALLSVTMNRPNVSSRYGDASHHSGSITLMININTTKCNLSDFHNLRMIKNILGGKAGASTEERTSSITGVICII